MEITDLDLRISPEARRIFPGLGAWAILAHWPPTAELGAIPPVPNHPDLELETLASHPRIAIWREAYQRMGLRPSACRSSVEQLVRRALRGEPARTGIAAVDLYNALSARHVAPIGGYDAETLGRDPLVIRPLSADDRFEPLGGRSEDMPLGPAILGYAQADECLCWALNHRDGRRTAITPQTCRALFVSEALDETGAKASRAALEEIIRTVERSGGVASKVVPFSTA